MTITLVACDYSRPVQSLFEQPPQAGRIHSIFRRAVNVDLADTMLALLSDELPRMPNSVRLPSAEAHVLFSNLKPHMAVWVGDGKLHIPACDFSLHLPAQPPWEPRPAIATHHWSREVVAQHIPLLARYVLEQSRPGGLASLLGPLLLGQSAPETPLAQMALPMLRLLARASWQQNTTEIAQAVRGLAGLGPGLTPSGDDVLAGFAAVMALLSPYLSIDAASREHIAAHIAAEAQARTTRLSAILLAHAARGEVAEHLGEMLLALASPPESSSIVLRAADRLLAFGETSGSDTLLGVLLALRTLEGGYL
jgi:hypothetical protein